VDARPAPPGALTLVVVGVKRAVGVDQSSPATSHSGRRLQLPRVLCICRTDLASRSYAKTAVERRVRNSGPERLCRTVAHRRGSVPSPLERSKWTRNVIWPSLKYLCDRAPTLGTAVSDRCLETPSAQVVGLGPTGRHTDD
jgi:hypothetical protein